MTIAAPFYSSRTLHGSQSSSLQEWECFLLQRRQTFLVRDDPPSSSTRNISWEVYPCCGQKVLLAYPKLCTLIS